MMCSSSAREIGIEAHGRDWCALQNGVEDEAGGVTPKRQRAGGHFIEDDAEGEKVGAGVEVLTARLVRATCRRRCRGLCRGW